MLAIQINFLLISEGHRVMHSFSTTDENPIDIPRPAIFSGMSEKSAAALKCVKALTIAMCTEAPDYSRSHPEAVNRFLERVISINQGASLAQAHETWRNLMLIDGWRLGPVYSRIYKTDPNLLKFEHLCPHRKLLDTVLRDCLIKNSQMPKVCKKADNASI